MIKPKPRMTILTILIVSICDTSNDPKDPDRDTKMSLNKHSIIDNSIIDTRISLIYKNHSDTTIRRLCTVKTSKKNNGNKLRYH